MLERYNKRCSKEITDYVGCHSTKNFLSSPPEIRWWKRNFEASINSNPVLTKIGGVIPDSVGAAKISSGTAAVKSINEPNSTLF